jgi:hypothetical protein
MLRKASKKIDDFASKGKVILPTRAYQNHSLGLSPKLETRVRSSKCDHRFPRPRGLVGGADLPGTGAPSIGVIVAPHEPE